MDTEAHYLDQVSPTGQIPMDLGRVDSEFLGFWMLWKCLDYVYQITLK